MPNKRVSLCPWIWPVLRYIYTSTNSFSVVQDADPFCFQYLSFKWIFLWQKTLLSPERILETNLLFCWIQNCIESLYAWNWKTQFSNMILCVVIYIPLWFSHFSFPRPWLLLICFSMPKFRIKCNLIWSLTLYRWFETLNYLFYNYWSQGI